MLKVSPAEPKETLFSAQKAQTFACGALKKTKILLVSPKTLKVLSAALK